MRGIAMFGFLECITGITGCGSDVPAPRDPVRCEDPVAVTVMTAGDFIGADIVLNGESTDKVTVDTIDGCDQDFVGVVLPEYMATPLLVGTTDVTLVVPIGRDIADNWVCDRNPVNRDVSMGAEVFVAVLAFGLLEPGVPLEDQRPLVVDVDMLSTQEGDVAGLVASDGKALEFTFGGVTVHCAR